jgi:hypothetical protein
MLKVKPCEISRHNNARIDQYSEKFSDDFKEIARHMHVQFVLILNGQLVPKNNDFIKHIL